MVLQPRLVVAVHVSYPIGFYTQSRLVHVALDDTHVPRFGASSRG
jgi:hypothetical protein